MDSKYVISKKSLQALEVDGLDGRSFIPDIQLDHLMTLRAIQATIEERCKDSGQDYELEKLAHEILDHSKKIFAILVLMKEENLIQDFIHKRYRDSSLLHSNEIPATVKDSKKFQRKKWMFLAPIFEAGDIHRELDARTIVPIVSQSRIGSGASGIVYKVELYRVQQKLVPGTPGDPVGIPKSIIVSRF